jgi:hypothetical protein
LQVKLFGMTARDVITILRQKISDAEKAGVRVVPLSNLRRLIDQIEQDKIGGVCTTRGRNSQSKSDRGSMNKKQKVLTVVALLVFITLSAFHYLTVTHFYYFSSNHRVPLLGISDPSHAIVSDVKTSWFMLGVIYTALFFLLQK